MEPPETYDFVFFGFWLSHVPDGRFEAFWRMVQRALRPQGTAFLVDTRAAPDAVARDQRHDTDGIVERRLNDGRTFRIVKIFHEPASLGARLSALGWTPNLKATPNFFVYGTATAGR